MKADGIGLRFMFAVAPKVRALACCFLFIFYHGWAEGSEWTTTVKLDDKISYLFHWTNEKGDYDSIYRMDYQVEGKTVENHEVFGQPVFNEDSSLVAIPNCRKSECEWEVRVFNLRTHSEWEPTQITYLLMPVVEMEDREWFSSEWIKNELIFRFKATEANVSLNCEGYKGSSGREYAICDTEWTTKMKTNETIELIFHWIVGNEESRIYKIDYLVQEKPVKSYDVFGLPVFNEDLSLLAMFACDQYGYCEQIIRVFDLKKNVELEAVTLPREPSSIKCLWKNRRLQVDFTFFVDVSTMSLPVDHTLYVDFPVQ